MNCGNGGIPDGFLPDNPFEWRRGGGVDEVGAAVIAEHLVLKLSKMVQVFTCNKHRSVRSEVGKSDDESANAKFVDNLE